MIRHNPVASILPPQDMGRSGDAEPMVAWIIRVVGLLIVLAGRHRSLALENLALRQQLALYRRSRPRPTMRWPDRLFWIGLRAAWRDWKSTLLVVRPATVVAWHRRAFAWYWTRRSRLRGGRPQAGAEIRRLVRETAVANPLWGAPRIHGELLTLGFEVSERTVSRLMPRRQKPSSQSWRTFLRNHVSSTVALYFFAVPTLTCRVLFVFVVLAHDSDNGIDQAGRTRRLSRGFGEGQVRRIERFCTFVLCRRLLRLARTCCSERARKGQRRC